MYIHTNTLEYNYLPSYVNICKNLFSVLCEPLFCDVSLWVLGLSEFFVSFLRPPLAIVRFNVNERIRIDKLEINEEIWKFNFARINKKKIFDENFDEKEKLILEINEEKETIWGCIKFLSNAEKLKRRKGRN